MTYRPGDWVSVLAQVAPETRVHPDDVTVTLFSHSAQYKWLKVGPFLTHPDGTREALLTLLAGLSKADGSQS